MPSDNKKVQTEIPFEEQIDSQVEQIERPLFFTDIFFWNKKSSVS